MKESIFTEKFYLCFSQRLFNSKSWLFIFFILLKCVLMNEYIDGCSLFGKIRGPIILKILIK